MRDSEHKFINSAFLSELWAAHDLEEKKSYFKIPDVLIDQQIEDEYRHAKMLRKSIENYGIKPILDTKYAMQNIIYKSVCGLNLKNTYSSMDLFWSMHEIMEKRAIWNYKTFNLGGKSATYKSILKNILLDEKNHLKKKEISNPKSEHISKLDRWVHRIHFFKFYNRMNLLDSPKFWEDYFSDNLVKAEFDVIGSVKV